jgi:hypothetical protein
VWITTKSVYLTKVRNDDGVWSTPLSE